MTTTLKTGRITLGLIALATSGYKAEYKAEQGLAIQLFIKDDTWSLALTCWCRHASEAEQAEWCSAFGIEIAEWKPTIKDGWQTMWCQWRAAEAGQGELPGMEVEETGEYYRE